MRHLYRSVVEVLTDGSYTRGGSLIHGWHRAESMFDPYLGRVGYLACRLDLNFIRPGKDEPPMQTGGRAPDRVGVLFCDPTPYLKVGHRLKCVDGPINGLFEIRNVPDEAQDYVGVHHLECSIVEVAQSLRKAMSVITPDPPMPVEIP